MILLMAALLLGPASTSHFTQCPQFDLTAQAGVAAQDNVAGEATDVGAAGGITVGANLQACMDVPLRAELGVRSHGLGSQTGVEAVTIGSQVLSVQALAGLDQWWTFSDISLGVEALVGPETRFTWVTLSVLGIESTTLETKPGLVFALGAALRRGGFHFGLRGETAVVTDRPLELLLNLGWAF